MTITTAHETRREDSAESKAVAGFQRTDAGLIPIEWRDLQIRDVCTLINGRGFKPHEWRDTGFPIIRIQNLNGSDEFNYYDGSFNPKILVEDGQLLFAWSGSRGTSFGPHVWHGSQGVLNYHTWKVVPNDRSIDATFLLHALRHLTAYIEDKAHGASALVHTQKWEMEGFHLAVPPLPEQRAIAAALSDVDELIGALDKLIAKKRAIKLAAMQQLLTGKTRLPGFASVTCQQWTELGEIPRDWRCTNLGMEINLLTGFPFPSAQYVESGVRLVRGSNVKRGVMDWSQDILQFWPSISTDIARYELQAGDLVIAMDGALVGRSYAVISHDDLPALLLQRVARIRSETIHRQLLPYLVGSEAFVRHVDSVKTHTAIPHISPADIRSFVVAIPSTMAEQEAIAVVLCDMDAEIAALKQRRDKTKSIKQGMMQSLLTGRVRLVEPEGRA